MKIELPPIERTQKWVVAGVGYIAFCLLYTVAGASPFRAPTLLPPSFADEFIPFMGWTVWIYHAQFFFLFFCCAALKRSVTITRTLSSMGLASLLAFITFFIYPTSVLRPQPPSTGMTAMAFALLYGMDSAANCFPSLHVALAWLAMIGVSEESRKRGVLAAVCAVLISISTLTTKQHYAVDVAGGLALAALCRALVIKVLVPVRR